MSLPPHLPDRKTGDKEYVHIRCLIANIHRPKNVAMPPSMYLEHSPPLEAVQESPLSSDTERSERSGSERSEDNLDEYLTPQKRTKSNSFAGAMLAPPVPVLQAKRRRSFLSLQMGAGGEHSPGPMSAGAHFNVPKFTVTAPPGEQRRFSHGFVGAFHGFALRRHSNTVCSVTVNGVKML